MGLILLRYVKIQKQVTAVDVFRGVSYCFIHIWFGICQDIAEESFYSSLDSLYHLCISCRFAFDLDWKASCHIEIRSYGERSLAELPRCHKARCYGFPPITSITSIARLTSQLIHLTPNTYFATFRLLFLPSPYRSY